MRNITRSAGTRCIEGIFDVQPCRSFIQRLLIRLLPSAWARSMEEESREWMIRCHCGHQQSVWDMGGIRWKARGNPRRFMTCPACGSSSWHRVSKNSGNH